MNLKGLIYRELGEGLTENELAAAIGVSRQTIDNIISDRMPKDITVWNKFSTYFRMDVEFLLTGELTSPPTLVKLSENDPHSSTLVMRKVPLLSWSQIDRLVTNKELFRAVRSDVMLETTDVPGKRTFALKVKDTSMQPLFSEGEIIFVNPDLKYKPGHYVVVESQRGRSGEAMLRQLKQLGSQYILHPLNRKYDDLPLTKEARIYGKVIRLRKDL
jgi:SOS-response transcriptional repressor LexA